MEGLYHDTTLEDSGASNIEGSDSPEKTSNLSTESMPSKDFANSDFNTALSAEDKINLLSQMVRIRRFEERSLRAYQQGHIGGVFASLHWSRGRCGRIGFCNGTR